MDRKYSQRLPTPGYDAFVDAIPAFASFLPGGISAAVANGFPLNSPYNADIPYDIKQTAVFGEASYDFGQFKLTAGARYYNFKEERDFVSGGIFSDVNTNLGDKTKSDGISPRVILTFEPNRNLSFNVQAAKGFRLGGINDPLNVPLCSPADLATFGGLGAYDDETLWNYEAGVKYSKGGITFNSAVFHNEIRDLQVTLDRGQLLIACRVQRSKSALDRPRSRILCPAASGSRILACRQHPKRQIQFDRHRRGSACRDRGNREGQPPADRAQVPDRRGRDLWPAAQ